MDENQTNPNEYPYGEPQKSTEYPYNQPQKTTEYPYGQTTNTEYPYTDNSAFVDFPGNNSFDPSWNTSDIQEDIETYTVPENTANSSSKGGFIAFVAVMLSIILIACVGVAYGIKNHKEADNATIYANTPSVAVTQSI